MSNKLVSIGNLFNLEKGELQSTKCTPGDFDFITAAEDWKKHNQYTHECEALIIAVAASGSLGRTHYVDGKFVISDLCFMLTPKDEEKYPLNLSFYHFVFNSIRSTLVAATKSGTSKESINQTNLKRYELTYFDIEQQDLWIEKLKNTLVRKNLLGSELTHQQTLLKKLRQQILQEAIEGKLTAEWRQQNSDVEPANELLSRIQAEKEQLIKDRKIKKQKSLPPIGDGEKPFDLPDGWVWCRLGDLILMNYGKGLNKAQTATTEKYPVYGSNGIVGFYDKCLTDKRAIIIGRKGSAGALKISNSGSWTTDVAYFIEESKRLSFEYLFNLLCSLNLESLGKGIKPGLSRDETYSLVVAFPPLPEQKAIVAKVEKLLTLCDQMEIQITASQTYAKQLMQAVLKEAFTQTSGTSEQMVIHV